MIIRADDTSWTFEPLEAPDVAAPASRCICVQTNSLTLGAHSDDLPPPPAGCPVPEETQPASVLCQMIAGMHASIRELLLGTDVEGLPLQTSLSIWGPEVNGLPC